MGKKLTIEHVKKVFEKEGYELLSTEYINCRSKLDFICPNGHTHSISISEFKAGNRCILCSRHKKYDIENVAKIFKTVGYTLMSKRYKNTHAKLKYICNKGHHSSIVLYNFLRGQRCPACAGKAKITIERAKELFESEGYVLLSSIVLNANTKLDYICPKGHKGSITWSSFLSGSRCYVCSIDIRSGKDNCNWKGGVANSNVPLYNTYHERVSLYQDVYKISKVINETSVTLLGTKCKFCKSVFVPSRSAVKGYISTREVAGTPSELYCSDKCKSNCPVYGKIKYPEGTRPGKRHGATTWANKVKSRDNYTCQKCDNKENLSVIAHHIIPVKTCDIMSLDIDNGITVCKNCHDDIHHVPGCTYTELRNS